MRLSLFTDYGLRALMRLAAAPDTSRTTAELADEFRISRHHLTKIVRQLAEAGYVRTSRGAGGGLRLARAPEAVTLGEVVRRLERGEPLVECFRVDGGRCTLTPGCRLKGRLAAAREAFLRQLDATTLAECAYPGAS